MNILLILFVDIECYDICPASKKFKSEAHHTNSSNGEGIGNVEFYSEKHFETWKKNPVDFGFPLTLLGWYPSADRLHPFA